MGSSRSHLRLIARILLLALAAVAITACARVKTRPVENQVVVLGFDGADPDLLAQWMKEGKLPNLQKLADSGSFKPLGTTNPPESPVAWATFATGLNPGSTGIFDFLKRNPKSYLPELALVSREKPEFLWGLIPLKKPKVVNLRGGVPFYKAAADAGYKTTVIRMPLEFPPVQIPGGKLWSGLGVPDLRGTWGTFFYFGSDLTRSVASDTEFGGKLVPIEVRDGVAQAIIVPAIVLAILTGTDNIFSAPEYSFGGDAKTWLPCSSPSDDDWVLGGLACRVPDYIGNEKADDKRRKHKSGDACVT